MHTPRLSVVALNFCHLVAPAMPKHCKTAVIVAMFGDMTTVQVRNLNRGTSPLLLNHERGSKAPTNGQDPTSSCSIIFTSNLKNFQHGRANTDLATRISSSMKVVSIQPALVPGISGKLILKGGSVDETSRPSSVCGAYCELRNERVMRLSPSNADAATTCSGEKIKQGERPEGG